ncbi:30S ribosomal protein S4 [Patescibacteria group bacterium]
MARYTGPKCRICRREGEKLYLKGTRCNTDKCAMNKRAYAPGQHGNSRRRRRRSSDYGSQLREKQKAKRIYGVLEKQFRKYVNQAMKSKGVTGEALLANLETRLDNMVYRSGFAVSRAQARQLVRNGVFTVNDKPVDVPSYQLKVGDVLKPIEFGKVHLREGFVLPDWLEANVKEKFVKFSRVPTLDDLAENINIQQIIEYYSR